MGLRLPIAAINSIQQAYVSRKIISSRGKILDRSENNVLAQSSSVEIVTVNPVNISKNDKEKVAEALANIFELDNNKRQDN